MLNLHIDINKLVKEIQDLLGEDTGSIPISELEEKIKEAKEAARDLKKEQEELNDATKNEGISEQDYLEMLNKEIEEIDK